MSVLTVEKIKKGVKITEVGREFYLDNTWKKSWGTKV